MKAPLQLRLKSTDAIVWENPHPSLTRLCRPIAFEFIKETKELIQKKFRNIPREIDFLLPTTAEKDGYKVTIHHNVSLKMVDGTPVSHIADVAFSNCNICGVKPSQVNNLNLNAITNKAVQALGLSTLHCWIRFFECLLHIAYKLTVKKWIVINAREKSIVLKRKLHIQQEFRSKRGQLK